ERREERAQREQRRGRPARARSGRRREPFDLLDEERRSRGLEAVRADELADEVPWRRLTLGQGLRELPGVLLERVGDAQQAAADLEQIAEVQRPALHPLELGVEDRQH